MRKIIAAAALSALLLTATPVVSSSFVQNPFIVLIEIEEEELIPRSRWRRRFRYSPFG